MRIITQHVKQLRSMLRVFSTVLFCATMMSCTITDPVELHNVRSLRLSANLDGGTEGKPNVEYRFQGTHSRLTIPVRYEWIFDDGTRVRSGDSAVARHSFSSVGLFAVMLRVLDANDDTERARSTLLVNIRDTFPSPKMVRVAAGSFSMGSNRLIDPSELPQHSVRITRPLLVSQYELNQAEWNSIMSTCPAWFQGDSLPAESVTWYEAVDFCNRLSIRSGFTPAYSIRGDTVQCFFSADGYRLPTEAEWEYFARAGTTTNFYNGAEQRSFAECLSGDTLEGVVDEIAWYCLNSGGSTHPCGLKAPNSLGLYDIVGNVAEWTWDWFDGTFYQRSGSDDPANSEKNLAGMKVARGGNAFSGTIDIRIPGRRINKKPELRNYGIGFRVVRSLPN